MTPFWRRPVAPPEPPPEDALLRKRVRIHFKPDTGFEPSIEGLLMDIVAGHYMVAAAEVIVARDIAGMESDNQALNPIAIPASAVLFWEIV